MNDQRYWHRPLVLLLIFVLAALTFAACTSSDGEDLSTAPNGDATVMEENAPQGDTGEASEPALDGNFELLDANANGTLEEREFNLLLAQAETAYDGQFGNYDADGDGHLSAEEFDAFLEMEGEARTADTLEGEADASEAPVAQEAPDYRTANISFDHYDANTNAYLEPEEFRTVLVMGGIPVEGQFGTYDANDDNRLDREEYRAFFEAEAGELDATGDGGQAS